MKNWSNGMINISKETTMGEIIENVPGSEVIIEKYFHGGCFECPAKKMESLEMGTMMHGHDVDAIIAELKKVSEERS
jgi:hybrid cluster-associated redox disulfide protein